MTCHLTQSKLHIFRSKYVELERFTHRKMLIAGTCFLMECVQGGRHSLGKHYQVLCTLRKFPPRKPATTTITGHTAAFKTTYSRIKHHHPCINPLLYRQKALLMQPTPPVITTLCLVRHRYTAIQFINHVDLK